MRAVDRRQAILDAALNVFSRKGFGGATTKEIAAAAGVTEAIIFRHFPSKHELYGAVLDLHTKTPELQEWLEHIHHCMARNDDAALFRALVGGVLSSFRDCVEHERVLLFAALEGHEFALAHYRQHSLEILGDFREYLTRRQREGALRDFCPALIVAALAGAAEFYATRTQMFGFSIGDLSDEAVIDTFTDIILKGISMAPEKPKPQEPEIAEPAPPAHRKKAGTPK
jgi:TetR/AcrR family transcriptional regulator